MTRVFRITALAATVALATPLARVSAETDTPASIGAGPAIRIVPDRYLRAWDPITWFFATATGPAKGGPLDAPDGLVSLTPEHPGTYTWLDARTLQFKPTVAWPSLARVNASSRGVKVSLDSLMSAPVATEPADGSEGLDPVTAITLTFAEAIEAAAVSRMVTIELRPLPGINHDHRSWLQGDDLAIKVLAAEGRNTSYVLTPKQPIPLGTRATLRLRLTLGDDPVAGLSTLNFSTRVPFRVIAIGCDGARFPVAATGSRYSREQALRCDGDPARLVIETSAEIATLDPIAARNLVRLTPAASGLTVTASGRELLIDGEFQRDQEYRLTLADAAIVDRAGRRLEAPTAEAYLFFPRRPDYLRFTAGDGIVERRGPQVVPLEGRGDRRVDLRIHAIDPLDRGLWPFPSEPFTVDEQNPPPGPGEEPAANSDPYRDPQPSELAARLRLLGSPAVSTLVDLPLGEDARAARLGLDLAPHLARIHGAGKPGTFLVGIRRLDTSSNRSWMRLQATDLAVTTMEERDGVRFVVTSLRDARPLGGASVRVEGARSERGNSAWTVFASGVTDAAGAWRWAAPGSTNNIQRRIRRIVVTLGDDRLVLDASRPPELYTDNRWQSDGSGWLDWTLGNLSARLPATERIAHIFTDRPVYRPEDLVHIKGWVRERLNGKLTPLSFRGSITVFGPGGVEWRYPIQVAANGGFHHGFSEPNLPTGDYRAVLELHNGGAVGEVAFQLDAYRIPQLEVRLEVPERVPNDAPFDVTLAAVYYAGGKVGDRPLSWRVTQFPYQWTPAARDGFRYSSDSRYSRSPGFESTPTLDRQEATDADGAARLTLDPASEPNALPRTYVIEATVTGPDDQTVSATRRVQALPPFVLGIKLPRFLEKAIAIEPEIIAVGGDGKLLADTAIRVTLKRRRWHSHLRASDFSDGVARYVTDVVDEDVATVAVTSASDPLKLSLPVAGAGVYVVELEATDRLGRAQVLSVDLYAGGDEPVAWARPTTRVFATTPDRESYDPGETANIVIESPFQHAAVLAMVEAPEGNRYEWLTVRGGKAEYKVPLLGTHTPRLPVHFVLMRGRLDAGGGVVGGLDLGKPTTMAATTWLTVRPVSNRLDLTLAYPQRALPGATIDVTVKLHDPAGQPLAGEVTLWLVDQAVLALGREQRLDPLPDFITPVSTHLSARDTRNLGFGDIAFSPLPGGDGGRAEAMSLLDRATVRKQFSPVPFYEPSLLIGPDGLATVKIQLPDNLTNFKLRAKAASDARFGFAVGHLAVRLPVIAQPALPRFVRPGDQFVAAAIGRIVEGGGGPGRVEARITGAKVVGESVRDFNWIADQPERFEFPLSVARDGAPETLTIAVGVERVSDSSRDAFSVELPVRNDQRLVRRRVIADLTPALPIEITAIDEPFRPGSAKRMLAAASEPALMRMLSGLNALLEYPHGCTEQRLSTARARLAFYRLRDQLGRIDSRDDDLIASVTRTAEWIAGNRDANGLASYWPGGTGYVSLTAWSLLFAIESRDAGIAIDATLIDDLATALTRSLRSDSKNFVDGEAWAERTWALNALALAGRTDAAYSSELARKASFLDLEGKSLVTIALLANHDSGVAQLPTLVQAINGGIVTRLHQGSEIFAGLQGQTSARSQLILPSAVRSLATATRALTAANSEDPRLRVLIAGLVTLGRGDGFGSTNANAEAILALEGYLRSAPVGVARKVFAGDASVAIGGQTRMARTAVALGALILRVEGGDATVLVDTEYVPSTPGSEIIAQTNGFVVARELARVPAGSDPVLERSAVVAKGIQHFAVGDVIEDHIQLVVPETRYFVALEVPLAAGVEPLNPALLTAPPEAKPSRASTRPWTYAIFGDDRVTFYYDTLPAGTYDFYFRVRAVTVGSFTQPPAVAELMYDGSVRGHSAGTRVEVKRGE